MTNHPHRSKQQQAKHTPELLAALKLIRRMASGLIDGEKTAAEVLAKCSAEAGVAIDTVEER